MTLSPRGYAAGPPQPPPVGGIQDEMPVGAGMLDSTQHHYHPPNISDPAAPKKTFTFTRKTVIIIAVVVVVIIGALVGGLVGGLRSKNSSPATSAQTTDPSNTGASTPAQTSSSAGTSSTTTREPDTTTTSGSSPGSTSTVSEIDTLRGTGGSENAYPTTATYSIIGASGISGISPTPFPGFDEEISSSSLLTNGDFKSGNFDGWTNDDGCWRVQTDPSTNGFSPLEESTTGNNLIARNPADDLSGGKSCNLTQVVTGLQPGTLELSFLWGHYERDKDTWFYVSAGPTSRPLVILAMQDTPGFSRTVEWTKAAYSIEFEGGDFVVTFSAHSQATSHDLAQVQLIQK
ncbi:hypothetical protein TWF718_001049 [Orbilia javanica]|uniref:Uncharacterized protein n=1 Tax=Orbilia javanica TaxID=47235 RepID=A0AAN8MUV3_9PEZI